MRYNPLSGFRFNKTTSIFVCLFLLFYSVKAEQNTVSGLWIGKEFCIGSAKERNLLFTIFNDNIVVRKIIDNHILHEEILGTSVLINRNGVNVFRIKLRLEWTLGDVTYEGQVIGNTARAGVSNMTINGQIQAHRQLRACSISFRKLGLNEVEHFRR